MNIWPIYSQPNDKATYNIIAGPENDVTVEIRSFAFLPHGWDFGMGDPIKPEMIRKALEIHSLGLELGLSTEATPEVDGGITLAFIYEEDAVDIRIHPDFTYTVTHERGIGIKFDRLARERRVNQSAALRYLYDLNKLKVNYILCSSCGVLRLGDLARKEDDLSPDLASTITSVASPSLSWSVWTNRALKYVTT